MKKYCLVLAVIGAFFISCKKDRVCSCTVVTVGTTTTTASVDLIGIDTSVVTPLSTVNLNKATFNKVSKRRAKNNCFNKSEAINESTPTTVPGFLSVVTTNTGTRTYSCKLE